MTEPGEPASSSTSRAPSMTSFLVTKEYRRFAEFCDAVRRYRYIGLCYGPPGVGKTLSARHYAGWDGVQPLLVSQLMGQTAPAQVLRARSLLYTPSVANSPRQIEQDITHRSLELHWTITDTLAPEG